jgi:hypothetical protein
VSGFFSKKLLKIRSQRDLISGGFATQVPETGTRRWRYLIIVELRIVDDIIESPSSPCASYTSFLNPFNMLHYQLYRIHRGFARYEKN